jgi:hypothetical protein
VAPTRDGPLKAVTEADRYCRQLPPAVARSRSGTSRAAPAGSPTKAAHETELIELGKTCPSGPDDCSDMYRYYWYRYATSSIICWSCRDAATGAIMQRIEEGTAQGGPMRTGLTPYPDNCSELAASRSLAEAGDLIRGVAATWSRQTGSPRERPNSGHDRRTDRLDAQA